LEHPEKDGYSYCLAKKNTTAIIEQSRKRAVIFCKNIFDPLYRAIL
jgi:hypothetical protein